MKTLAVLLVLALLGGAAAAQTGATPAAQSAAKPAVQAVAPSPANGAAIVERETKLANELRCLVCQNQSIAESNAELAVDLRRQIRELIAQGKTDAEIRDYMTARYGDFVLYRPPLKGTTALLWFGPALLLAIGAAIALRFVRRRGAAGRDGAPAMTAEEQSRAARLLGQPVVPAGSDAGGNARAEGGTKA